MWCKASAPGSLMLLGEYAVLKGKHALVCAINKRMTIFISPRTDKKATISSRLGKLAIDISNIVPQAPFQFVLTAIKRYQHKLTLGFDLTIESEFSHEIGFGSSAAVTVATLAAFTKWIDHKDFDATALILEARSVIQEVQGLGSGADVAACVLGGIVAYQMEPFIAERLPNVFPLTVVYSGSKTPTAIAVQQVMGAFEDRPQEFQQICQQIDECVISGTQYVREKKWHEFGRVMASQQKLMNNLGVNTPELTEIIEKLDQQPGILGSKISGAGLGDSVIALGSLGELTAFDNPKIKIFSTSISMRGVEYEED